jgi:hypothetical protein
MIGKSYFSFKSNIEKKMKQIIFYLVSNIYDKQLTKTIIKMFANTNSFQRRNSYGHGSYGYSSNPSRSKNNRNGYNTRQNGRTLQTKHSVPQVLKTPDISNAKIFPAIASSHMKPTARVHTTPPMYSDKYLQSISVTTTNLTPSAPTTKNNKSNISDTNTYEHRRGWINSQIKKSFMDLDKDSRNVEIDNENAFNVLNGLNELYFSRLFQYVDTYNQNTHGKYRDVEQVEQLMRNTFHIDPPQCTDDDDDPYYDSEYDE